MNGRIHIESDIHLISKIMSSLLLHKTVHIHTYIKHAILTLRFILKFKHFIKTSGSESHKS